MSLTMRLMTWNIWGRAGDWEARQDAIDATLIRSRPDIIAIQETWQVHDKSPQVSRLADLLGHDAVTVHPPATLDQDRGLAILSRWPISDYRAIALPDGIEEREQRLGLLASIDTPAGELPLCNTHLSWRLDQSHIRQAQVRELVQVIAQPTPRALPPILCGDFNAVPMSDEIRMLTGLVEVPIPGTVFQDAWDAGGDGGPGYTWSHTNPEAAKERFGNARLDYVFHRWHGRGVVLRATVVEGERPGGVWASDHSGLLVEYDLEAMADAPTSS